MLIIKRVQSVVSTLVKETAKESSLMRSYSTKAVVLKCSLSLSTNFLDNYKIFGTTPKRLILDFVLSISQQNQSQRDVLNCLPCFSCFCAQ